MIVYVAGPYRGRSRFRLVRWFQCVRNILRARRVAYRLWQLGHVAVCPHMNTALFGGDQQTYLDGDIAMLRRCDAMVLVPGFARSRGTMEEIKVAVKLKIPTYSSVEAFEAAVTVGELE